MLLQVLTWRKQAFQLQPLFFLFHSRDISQIHNKIYILTIIIPLKYHMKYDVATQLR